MIWMLFTAHAGTFDVLDGPRPVRDMHVAVHTRRATLANCFQSGPGPAKFHITVGADGLVSGAKYSMSASTDPAMLQCLYSEALQLRLLPNGDTSPTTFVWMPTRDNVATPPDREAPKPGEIWTEGGLAEADVRAKLQQNESQFAYCERKAGSLGLPLPPYLTATFQIAGDGSVQGVTLKEITTPDAFSECVLGRFQSIGFPASADGSPTQVVYPVAFAK